MSRNKFRSKRELGVGMDIRWEKKLVRRWAGAGLNKVRGDGVDLVDSERSL
jgi:hypothetical protein